MDVPRYVRVMLEKYPEDARVIGNASLMTRPRPRPSDPILYSGGTILPIWRGESDKTLPSIQGCHRGNGEPGR